MQNPTPDINAVLELLEEMTDTDAQWQRTRALYTYPDGAVQAGFHREHEAAKVRQGWDLVGILPEWIAALTAALAGEDAS